MGETYTIVTDESEGKLRRSLELFESHIPKNYMRADGGAALSQSQSLLLGGLKLAQQYIAVDDDVKTRVQQIVHLIDAALLAHP